MADEDLSEAEIARYARHIVLPEIGGIGQLALRRARVLVIGCGGLGTPLLQYVALSGVGTLGVVDHDRVDPSNLHRQVLFDAGTEGERKVAAAARRLRQLNPAVAIVEHDVELVAGNVADLIAGYDLVADGSDNLPTRIAVHDACRRAEKILVSASVQGFDGQLTTYKAFLGAPHPCLHCLFEDDMEAQALPSCAQGGVLGPAAGVMGTLQAVELVKELLGIGRSLSGTLVLYDALRSQFEHIKVQRRADCPACATAGREPRVASSPLASGQAAGSGR